MNGGGRLTEKFNINFYCQTCTRYEYCGLVGNEKHCDRQLYDPSILKLLIYKIKQKLYLIITKGDI